MIEFVDHLHEHFVSPVVISKGSYQTPLAPGSGAEMLAGSIEQNRFANDG
jgi:L-fuconate dehydratase